MITPPLQRVYASRLAIALRDDSIYLAPCRALQHASRRITFHSPPLLCCAQGRHQLDRRTATSFAFAQRTKGGDATYRGLGGRLSVASIEYAAPPHPNQSGPRIQIDRCQPRDRAYATITSAGSSHIASVEGGLPRKTWGQEKAPLLWTQGSPGITTEPWGRRYCHWTALPTRLYPQCSVVAQNGAHAAMRHSEDGHGHLNSHVNSERDGRPRHDSARDLQRAPQPRPEKGRCRPLQVVA